MHLTRCCLLLQQPLMLNDGSTSLSHSNKNITKHITRIIPIVDAH